MQKLKDQSTESWAEEVARCPQALATQASCYQRLSLRTHVKMEEEPLLHKAVYLLTIHTSVMVAQRTYVICTHNNENCKRLKATALETRQIGSSTWTQMIASSANLATFVKRKLNRNIIHLALPNLSLKINNKKSTKNLKVGAEPGAPAKGFQVLTKKWKNTQYSSLCLGMLQKALQSWLSGCSGPGIWRSGKVTGLLS